MVDRNSLLAFSLIALASFPAFAQQPKKVPRVAVVFASPASSVQDRFEAFRQAMRELGYVEGKNIVIDVRYADGTPDRLPPLLAEVVRDKVNAIVTGGSAVTRVAKDATSTIPIVMAQEGDPVGTGMVASLSRPGGNITGLSTITPHLVGKQLEILKELLPAVSRVAVISSSTQLWTEQALIDAERVAAGLRMQLQKLDLPKPGDIETVLRAASNGKAQALLVMQSFVILSQRTRIGEYSMKNRLPSIFPQLDYVDAGGLISYGTSTIESHRRAAVFVDKILKGAKPADLPVEQPTKFELVINMKTAKALGLTIPQSVLVRADRVIE